MMNDLIKIKPMINADVKLYYLDISKASEDNLKKLMYLQKIRDMILFINKKYCR